jgi:hypothetical protein
MDVTGDAAPRVELEANAGGTLHVGVSLRDARTDELLDARRFAAAIEVSESGRILVLAGAGSTLAASLARAGWRVDERPVARADAHRERLAGYDAVALDDVAADDASEAFWHELAAQVRDRGTGLLVLGGERAFGRGGYRRSALESVLPVLSEPAALDRPAAVVFAVDKSGSMGEGSGGVNRLALAERAVIESVRTLGTRDRVSIVAFDAEARVLLPATPAADAAAAVQRAWGIDARGGTRLEPAVVRALDELDGAADGRRVLVLVTDGFADEGAPLDALRERLATAGIEVLALAVGADADAAALERLVAPGRGAVLRVAEAAELPQVMPAALERHRARVERGPLAVRVVETPPFLASAPSAWPSIDAYAVVRLRPGVTPWLESARGDPLLVGWRAGAGRVVAAPGGLGAWTRRWLAWEAWPAFASGLAAWVSGAVGPAVIAVTEDADGLIVDVDLPDAPPGSAAASLDFVSPSGRRGAVPLRVDAPGRLRGLVPSAEAGAWTLVASVGGATARTVHLRDARVEEEGWGVDPAVERWRAAGLVHDVGRPPPDRVLDRERSPDPRWLVAALVLAVAAIVVDRLPRGRAGGIAAVRERVRAIVRRTRSRSAA